MRASQGHTRVARAPFSSFILPAVWTDLRMQPMADAAGETLTALEERLRRVELLLRGGAEGRDTNGPSEEDSRPVASRLDKIEKRLAEICSHSEPIGELLQLRT